ncbi:MAG: tetratricopeptide repeat protein [Lentisphaerae bacterium]|nr:tetratricopeptide repeat protein [Lentisphaerota bacterium]
MRSYIPPHVARVSVGCCLLALAAGCASVWSSEPSARLALTPAERNQAAAIAHYAQGLIDEELDGRLSPRVLAEYDQAAKLDPGHHRLYAKAATAHLLNEDSQHAIALLEHSCREQPDSWLARVDLATAYQFIGNNEQAARQFRAAMRIDPTRVEVHMTLANLYFSMKRDREALAVLEKGIRTNNSPDLLRALAYKRGLQFIDENEATRALPCFQFVVKHTANQRSQVYYLIGQLYENINLLKEARQCYAWAAREEPPLPQAHVKLALLELDESPARALDILDRAQRAMPDDVLIPMAKAQILSSQGRYTEAIPAFTVVADIMRRLPETKVPSSFYLYYGAAYERCGDVSRAEEVFEECLRRYPDTHEVLNYLAYMWAERGEKLDRGLSYINRALKLEPENGAYLDTLGWIYYRLGQFDDALKLIQAADRLIPDDPTINDHLGDAWNALGNHERAIQHWKHSYLKDRDNSTVAKKLQANGVDLDALVRAEEAEARTPSP